MKYKCTREIQNLWMLILRYIQLQIMHYINNILRKMEIQYYHYYLDHPCEILNFLYEQNIFLERWHWN